MSRPRNPWHVLLTLCLGQSVALLDTTAVNVAIPSMIDGLGASLDQILWVLNGYLLTYAVLLVTGGRLGDLFGQKRLFLSGVVAFTLASTMCGLAQTPGQLIAARLLQGVGGAMLTPQALAIVSHIFPPERRGAALGVWGAFVSGAAAVGPTLGGLIVSSLGWRWVFFINLPIGLAALVLGIVIVPDIRRDRQHTFDVVGTVVLTAALSALVFGLLEGPRHAWGQVWGPISVPALLVGGVLLLVVFGHVERGRQDREPLVPFAVLRQRNFALMAVVVAALPSSLGAMLLLTTVYLQSGLTMSALAAGLAVAAAPLVSMVCAPVAGRLTDRYGGKYVMMAGFLLWAGGIGYLALVARADSGWFDLLPGLVIAGVGMGVTFSPPATLAMRDIDPSMSGAASGLFNMTRLSGSLLGAAAVGAVLQSRLNLAFADAAARHATRLPAQYRQPFLDAFTDVASPDLSGVREQTMSALAGLPREYAEAVQQAVFRDGITDAVRFTYLLPIAVLLAGALGALAVRERGNAERLAV
ncbi:MAG: MFS transporter [Kibdelosporangium sp.]